MHQHRPLDALRLQRSYPTDLITISSFMGTGLSQSIESIESINQQSNQSTNKLTHTASMLGSHTYRDH